MEEPEKMHLFGDKREAGNPVLLSPVEQPIKDAVITPCLVPPCKGRAAIENHLNSLVFFLK